MSPRKHPSLDSLTSIRFFLAFWVVIFHLTRNGAMLAPYNPALPGWAINISSTGYAAVGIFFVLSGFLLSYGYDLSEPWGPAHRHRFWMARFARIYPVYLLGLVVSGPFILYQIVFAPDLSSLIGCLFKSAAAITLLQSWVPDAVFFWNWPGWSLSVEAFFYLLFPFIGTALWKIEGRSRLLAAALAVWAAGMGLTALVTWWTEPAFLGLSSAASPVGDFWMAVIKFNPLLRLPEFCAGILLAKLFLSLRESPTGFLKVGAGAWLYWPAIALEFIGYSYASRFSYPLIHNGLMLPVHAMLILGLALGGGALTRFLSLPTMVLLGQASYALYLLHGPFLQWIVAIYHRLAHASPFGFGWSIFYVSVTLLASIVTFRYLEEPARRCLNERFQRWSTRTQTVQTAVPLKG